MTDWLERIAVFSEKFSLADIDATTRQQASYVLLDTMGAIIGGAAEPEYRNLAKRHTKGMHGGASVIGLGRGVPPATAAFLNGTAGTFLELDEGNRFARGHPAVHVLPAAVAYAQAHGLGGTALLEALILGYEISTRLGAACHLRPDMHPHGTWGTIGAAVAVGKLAQYDAASMVKLINIASSLTLATSKQTMLQGATVRNVYAGVSNQFGLLAAELMASGFIGEADGISSVFGRVVSEHFDPDVMTSELGQTWQITRNYFKLHACCRYNHAALDALENLLDAHGPLDLSCIEHIDVFTYGYAAELNDPAPKNILAAKFSVPFALATRLVTGSSGMHAFTQETIQNPAILSLAKRVAVYEDAAMTASLPNNRPAMLRLSVDGRQLEARVDLSRGDEELPYTRQELENKFDSLAQRLLCDVAVDQLRAALLHVTGVADVSTLFAQTGLHEAGDISDAQAE